MLESVLLVFMLFGIGVSFWLLVGMLLMFFFSVWVDSSVFLLVSDLLYIVLVMWFCM